MDELNISGKRYLSSRRVAKENGYHTDYIGQLIRSGKITGQKVGRTWYVEAGSFDAYLGQESAAPAVEVVIAPDETVIETPMTITPAPALVSDAPNEIVEPTLAVAEISEEIDPIAMHLEQKIDEPVVSAPAVMAPIVEESRPVAISVRSTEAMPPASHKPLGLRYVPHDEPLLPEIPRNERITRVMPQTHTMDTSNDSEEEVVIRPRKRGGLILVGLAIVGVAVFAGSAVVSSGVSQTINIDGDNSASASYALQF